MKINQLLKFSIYNAKKHPFRLVLTTITISVLLLVVSLCWFIFLDGYIGVKENMEKDYAERGDILNIVATGENFTTVNKRILTEALCKVYPSGFTFSFGSIGHLNVKSINRMSLDTLKKHQFVWISEALAPDALVEGATFENTEDNKIWMSYTDVNNLQNLLQCVFKIGDTIEIGLEADINSGKEMNITYLIAGFIGGYESYIPAANALKYGFAVGFPEVVILPTAIDFDNIGGTVLQNKLSLAFSHFVSVESRYYANALKAFTKTLYLQFALTLGLTILLLAAIAFILSGATMLMTYDCGSFLSMSRMLGLTRKNLFTILLSENLASSTIALGIAYLMAFFSQDALSGIALNLWAAPLALLKNHILPTAFYWYIPLVGFIIFCTFTFLTTFVSYKKFSNKLFLKTMREDKS